jgi:hypothetical protein
MDAEKSSPDLWRRETMKKIVEVALMGAVVAAVHIAPAHGTPEFYYDLDSTYAVAPSDTKITVQFDTTVMPLERAGFFAAGWPGPWSGYIRIMGNE